MVLRSIRNKVLPGQKLSVILQFTRSKLLQSWKLPHFHPCLRVATLLVAVRGRTRLPVVPDILHTRTMKQLTVCTTLRQ